MIFVYDYEILNGQIVGKLNAPFESWAGPLMPNLGRIVSASDYEMTSSYVEGELLQLKQSMTLIATNNTLTANGTDEAIISGIPEGVQVQWPDGQTDIVTDGEIRFSVDLPGTYTFRFTAVSYLNKEITIEAISAN